MNLNNTTKSTEELKNQVLNDLKKVREDFDEIKTRMTPGQIIDDAIYYRRGGGNPAQTFDHLKNNPVGTTFLTLGTLLLMEDSEHHTFEGLARERASEVKARVTGVVSSAKEKIDMVQDKARKVKGTIQSKLPNKGHGIEGISGDTSLGSDVSSNVSGKVDDLKSMAHEGLESAKGNIRNIADSAKEGLQGAKSKVKEVYQSASSTVRNLDPLTYLALGAGLGTLTGAAMPVSDAEESFVDEKIQARVMEFRKDLENALNQSANILKNEFIGDVTNIKMNLF